MKKSLFWGVNGGCRLKDKNMSKNKSPDFSLLRSVLLREGEPERIPLYEHYVDDEIIESISGEPVTKMDRTKKEENEKYLKAVIGFYHKMGYDYVPIEVFPDLPRDNVLVTKDTAGHERDKGREWQDENDGVIKSPEDFEKYPWPANDKILDYSTFEIASRNLPDGMKIIGGLAGGVFEHLSWLMGLVPMSYALFESTDLIQAMVDRIGEMIITADRNILQICGDKFGSLRSGDDMGYKTATMISPDALRKYIFPWQKRIVELAHENGLPFILHSCGQLEKIMDDLIDFLKIDAKHSYEDVITPVAEFKQKYGSRVAVLGGIDMDKLCTMEEQDLRKYVRDILEQCAPGGGYAMGSGNSIANYVKVDNYLAMLDETAKFNK